MKTTKILELRPTQFVLGMKEVSAKIKKMSAFNSLELKKYCDNHYIPVIRGPNKELYIIDHHHFARACWELDVKIYEIKVFEDKNQLSESEFWNYLIRRKWTNLHDQFGFGPHSPLSLPADIRCMADDPFRSLVWTLIQEGVIQKESIPFFEFEWAAYFRLNLEIPLHSKSSFDEAIKLGKKLAKASQSSHLPGFIKK